MTYFIALLSFGSVLSYLTITTTQAYDQLILILLFKYLLLTLENTRKAVKLRKPLLYIVGTRA